jgi:hypothetical protein
MHVNRSHHDILRDLKKLIAEFAEVEQVTTKGPASELARYYIEIKEFYEDLHDVSKELTKLKDQMAYKDVPAAFEREGTDSITTKNGYRVTISALIRASCKEMDKAVEWMEEHGNEGLVKRTINAQTLAAFVRSEMEEGREVPDDIFTVSIGQNTSVTKVK